MGNAFLNGGQTCMAWTRMLVPDRATTRHWIWWRPRCRNTPSGTMGSGHPDRAVSVVIAIPDRPPFIRRAQRDGARLLVGGAERVRDVGYYVQPTVFRRCRPDSELGQEEVFGPVLAVIPFSDSDDALRIANGTPYGLSGAVWPATTRPPVEFARRCRPVNSTSTAEVQPAPVRRQRSRASAANSADRLRGVPQIKSLQMNSTLRIENSGPTQVWTINLPEVGNAITDTGLIAAVEAAVDAANADTAVRAAILTSEGKIFSAGGNVKEMADRDGMPGLDPIEQRHAYVSGIQRIPRALARLEVPAHRPGGKRAGHRGGLRLGDDVRYPGGLRARLLCREVSLPEFRPRPRDGGHWFSHVPSATNRRRR